MAHPCQPHFQLSPHVGLPLGLAFGTGTTGKLRILNKKLQRGAISRYSSRWTGLVSLCGGARFCMLDHGAGDAVPRGIRRSEALVEETG